MTIIKPLAGLLQEGTLASFFDLDYPNFELIFCLQTNNDLEGISMVQRLCRRYAARTHIKCRYYTGASDIGANPKINNIAAAYASAVYDLIWISDAQLECPSPATLRTLINAYHSRGVDAVGLVHQLPLISRCKTWASAVEQVFFATQHARFYLFFDVIGVNCVNGMSILFSRQHLAADGGLAPFSRYLAEDYFISEALFRRGHLPCLAPEPALQTRSNEQTLQHVYMRQVRWTRLRKTMIPVPTALELFTESIPVGLLLALAWAEGSVMLGAGLFAGNLLASLACDWTMYRVLQFGLDEAMRLPAFLAAWMLREIGTIPRYIDGVLGNTVTWEGKVFKLHPGGTARRLSGPEDIS